MRRSDCLLGVLKDTFDQTGSEVEFRTHKFEIDADYFDIKEIGGKFVTSPFVWSEWADELVFFVAIWDVHFSLTDRQGVHLSITLRLRTENYVGSWLSNIMSCIGYLAASCDPLESMSSFLPVCIIYVCRSWFLALSSLLHILSLFFANGLCGIWHQFERAFLLWSLMVYTRI